MGTTLPEDFYISKLIQPHNISIMKILCIFNMIDMIWMIKFSFVARRNASSVAKRMIIHVFRYQNICFPVIEWLPLCSNLANKR